MSVPIIIYDACVLYPAHLRDILIRLAQAGLVRARWTNKILDEAFDNILADRPDLGPARLIRTRDLMNQALPDALVLGYEAVIERIQLPDPNDRHVFAAAIVANASVIVTFNLNDFPRDRLAAFDIDAQHPDDVVSDLVRLFPDIVLSVVREMRDDLRSQPPLSSLLRTLEGSGLSDSVARLRMLFANSFVE